MAYRMFYDADIGVQWKRARGCLSIKMPSDQYRDPHFKDKMVSWSSYL